MRTASDEMAMTRTPVAVGVDVGGTKLIACSLDADASILTRARTRSPVGDADMLLDEIARLAAEVGDGLPVGVGVPGPVSRGGVISHAPNLDVTGLDVLDGLTERLGSRPTVTNDASAALIGEHAVGAAQGHDHVVMLTVGTGVGGAVLVDGALLEGENGHAGELGHVLADPDGPVCGCGAVGCLEAVASGTAMARRARDLVASGAGTVLAEVDVIDGRAIDDAARAGDDIARTTRREAGEHLGRAAASLVNVFDPALVLLGGGAGVNAAQDLLPAMQQCMQQRLAGFARPVPPIAVAMLGDDAGMIGAGLLALRASERGP